jgi:hypothetical protein
MNCGVLFRSATMSDSEEDKKNVLPFHEMGLDDRILKAVAKLGWIEPTLIQVTRAHYPRSSVADPEPTGFKIILAGNHSGSEQLRILNEVEV